MTLAVSVRSYLKATKLNELRSAFLERAKCDAVFLGAKRALLEGADDRAALAAIKSVAHGLAGASGIYGLDAMGREAEIMGVTLASATDDELVETHAAIVEGLRNGTLTPIVGKEFPLAEAARAQEEVMKPGAFGKIVLIP